MLLKIVGLFFVALGAIGIFLPLLPTTPFLIVAASCFAKSSPRLYQMLIDNKVFGPVIVNWQRNKTIPKKAKVISLTMMLLAVIWSCYRLELWYLQALVVCLVIWPFVFIARLPLTQLKIKK